MDEKTQREFARVLGMRPREVIDVVKADGGALVRTHDGVWTHVADDGTLTFKVDGPSHAPAKAAAKPKA